MYVVLLFPARPLAYAGVALTSMAVLQFLQLREMKKLRQAWAPDPVVVPKEEQEPPAVIHSSRRKVNRK